MRLLRVQVPEFRALKDVDISFEPDFTPQVFPLGSLNGGGKSTLLQLIFVLLSCVWDNVGIEKYLKNIIEFFNKNTVNFKKISTINIITRYGKIEIQYYYGDKSILPEKLTNIQKKIKENYFSYQHYAYHICLLINFTEQKKTGEEEVDLLNGSKILYETIEEIKKSVFLISPSNQPHIFLSREDNRLLFTTNPEKTYDQILKFIKDTLPNFYTYDFIDVLTEVCRLERDKDFDEQIETGIYGTHYKKLESSINNLFTDGKKIIPLTIQQKRHTKDAIQSMGFKLPSGEEIYPEDLSHGELKRLAIFVLIKYHEMQDAVVLMDEIENGFHPDWQYQIVRDLVEWGQGNQYILATHSYELCTAVTPAHVKELEPRLTK